jgi:hypothetical protein
MKRILTFVAIISVTSLSTFTGCLMKTDMAPAMSGVINDTLQFNGTTKTKVYAQVDTTTHSPQLVVVTGVSNVYTPGTSTLPTVVLTAPHTEGVFTIDTNNNTVRRTRVFTSATGSAGSIAVSGEINILKIDKGQIIGSFSLTCADGTKVTNGQFRAEENYY